MTIAAEHERAGEPDGLPDPGPCSAASHAAGELGCVPALEAAWTVVFTHGARGAACDEPAYARVCEGRRAWIDGQGPQPARCPDCHRLGAYADFVRITTQL